MDVKQFEELALIKLGRINFFLNPPEFLNVWSTFQGFQPSYKVHNVSAKRTLASDFNGCYIADFSVVVYSLNFKYFSVCDICMPM